MSMMGHFQRLFAYDEWANREVLALLQGSEVPPPRSVKLLAHIVSAERLWLERLRLQKQTYPVWPDFTMAQCKLEVEELPRLWPDNPDSYAQAAWFLIQCAEVSPDRRVDYYDRAVHILAQGVNRETLDRKALDQPALQPLRQREDFRRLRNPPKSPVAG